MLPVVPMNSTSRDGLSVACARRISAVVRASRLQMFLVVLIVMGAIPAFARQPNLLLNGDLSSGSNDTPRDWTRSALALPGSLKWSPAGELEIDTGAAQFRVFYWNQTVTLAEPGWYHLRAEAKTDNPGVRAALKIEGAGSTGGATESNLEWKPIEIYFKVAASENVKIGCGVRGISAGNARFRNLTLTGIAGAPPGGARLIDLTPVLDLPRSEIKALHDVDLAQAPADESLWADVLNVRVIAALLLIFAVLTYLDRRYAGGRVARAGFFKDYELRKSAAVAAFLCFTLLGTWLVT